MNDQMNFFDLPCFENPIPSAAGCTNCVCRNCMYWWSARCPHGGCYDDLRAKEFPYIQAHPNEIRAGWSDWDKPGEQEHWCRSGICYPATRCEYFVQYIGQNVMQCLKSAVSVFQDGYILCGLIENYGCERCMQEFEEKNQEDER